MDINVTKDGGVIRLKVTGEFNIYSAADIKARLMELLSECHKMELDLEGVIEIDTSGVQLLLLAKREADMLGKDFRLSACGDSVGSAMTLYNLKDFFRIQ
ncbi:MAG: hypothetical protein A3J24_03855 [Deltaproteobacteria bacterium RIFCSPLOWO2_02_FULL_53_8]|nr:MAG: hypothetical protein A3J24_03855 [Deltaproteobacteria bacterium RIFCSPLOWO2_02_FULL_53_8]